MTRAALFTAAFLAAHPAVAADNELKPVAEFKLNTAVSRFIPSRDAKFVYFLNKSDGKLQRIDTAKKALDAAEVETTEGAEFFTLSPAGGTAFISASPKGHDRYAMGDKQSGTIQVIDTAAMKVTSTFAIKFDPFEIAATDTTVYVAGGSGQHTKVVSIDPKKKSVVGDLTSTYMLSNMRMMPDGKRLYLSTNGLSPGSTNGVWLGGAGKPATSSGPGGGDFDITPDGKFLVLQSGAVLRIGRSATDDLKETGKVGRNRGIAVDADAKIVWVAGADGTLVKHSYPDFELQETFTLPKPAYRLYLDAKTKLLFAALDNRKDAAANDSSGVGNIAIFDLNKKD